MLTKAPPVVLPEVDRRLLGELLAKRDDQPEHELQGLMRKIRPVVSDNQGRRFYVEAGHPRDVAFNLDAMIMERADGPGGIVWDSTIYTLHFVGPSGEFQASFAEVVAMIPWPLLGKIVAFETIGPRTDADFMRQSTAVNAGYHVAATHLYV